MGWSPIPLPFEKTIEKRVRRKTHALLRNAGLLIEAPSPSASAPSASAPSASAPSASAPSASAPSASTPSVAEPTLSGDGTQWTPPTWDELVREHADRVYQLAYRLTGNQHDAEDLTQETFVRAFRSMSTLKPNTVEGWLRRITTNLFLDMVRRRARVRMEHSPADSKLDSDGRITEDLESIQERIDSVLTGLREDQLTISEQLHRTG